MIKTYRPSELALMEQARRALDGRIGPTDSLRPVAVRFTQLRDLVGPPPVRFDKPAFGTPGYALALALGWISEADAQGDRAAYEQRSRRSLQTCHRFTLYERPRFERPRESGAYVPELGARLEDDRNLTDGARRCARKIAELAYRRSREGRALEITVTYLMEALGRCRRTVQRYLRVLEREGYIRADVVRGTRSRLCVGLMVHLLKPLLARHHWQRWPESVENPDATEKSQNNRFRESFRDKRRIISRNAWAARCMDGVYRALMKTIPAAAAPS